uniref:Nucleolar complex protein 2 homolog n=2 Tax=Parascaris univalens TaxID=6257 RepID=A0A915AIX9_PARUN
MVELRTMSLKKKSKKVRSGQHPKRINKGSPASKSGLTSDVGETSHKLTHQQELAAIAKNDPEFFKFLQEQDADLLRFNESDVDSISAQENDEVSAMAMESDADESATNETSKVIVDNDGRRIVDQPSVDALREAFISSEKTPSWAVRAAVKAFMACVARVGASIDPPNFVINDDTVFEDVIRLCFRYLGTSLYEVLGPAIKSTAKKEPCNGEEVLNAAEGTGIDRYKRWRKWNAVTKQYLHALLLFLNEVQNADVVVCTLRAAAEVAELYVHFNRLSKSLIKAAVRIWGRKTLDCRLASMLVLCKVVRVNKHFYPTVLKSCYLEYVSNVREVTPETWSLITFMQKAFAEIVHIYPAVAFPYAFVYVRQLAIHLRNAMIAKRKELIQTIYNWQFMQCIYIWAEVIVKAYSIQDEETRAIIELVYPLCQVIVATMRLYPSMKYVPLRLHCIKALLLLQVNCNVYIPTLSLAVQQLDDVRLTLKKKPSKGKGTMKNINVNCLLRASSSQLEDAGFRQVLVEELFMVHLEAVYVLRSSCAFADIVRPFDGQIKCFLKSCMNADYVRLFKSLSSKINEHAKWVDAIVAAREVHLNDQLNLGSLEADLASSDSPFAKFYQSWQACKVQKESTAQVFASKVISKKKDSAEEGANGRKAARKWQEARTEVAAEVQDDGNAQDIQACSGKPKMTRRKKKLTAANKKVHNEPMLEEDQNGTDDLVDFVMSDSE